MWKFVVALCLLPASPSLAQTAGAAVSAKAQEADEKRFCRRMEATGSIMSVKVCHTRAEWSDIDAANARRNEKSHGSNIIDGAQGGAGNGRNTFGNAG